MKRYTPICLILITFVAALAITACAKPPTAEMDNASAAVTRAENEPDVVVYAESTLKRAQDTLKRMKEAADSKKYDDAKLLAQEASSLADRAIADAKTAAAKAKQDAANMISSVKAAITEAEQALANAKTVRNIRLDLTAITAEIDNAKKLNQDAEAAALRNSNKEALDKATNARSSVGNAMNMISTAARESSRKQ